MRRVPPIFTVSTGIVIVSCAIVLLSGALAGAQSSSAAPACTVPNQPARTVQAVPARTPEIALQQNIFGVVNVLIDLDENSQVVGARVSRSSSALLNNAAVQAAKQSTFQTTIRDCKPVAGSFIFIVEFSDPRPLPQAFGFLVGNWDCTSDRGVHIRRTYDVTGTILIEHPADSNVAADEPERIAFRRDGGQIQMMRTNKRTAYAPAYAEASGADRVVFTTAVQPKLALGSLIERFTLDETDSDHYTWTSAVGADVSGLTATRVEHCAVTDR